jgi:hypothetical protein
VPWQGGELCAALSEFAPGAFDTTPTKNGDCKFETWIPSGIRARLVNVWKYNLQVSAQPPEGVAAKIADVDCKAYREHNATTGSPLWFRHNAQCWVSPGAALVSTRLNGKQGW